MVLLRDASSHDGEWEYDGTTMGFGMVFLESHRHWLAVELPRRPKCCDHWPNMNSSNFYKGLLNVDAFILLVPL